MVLTRFARKKNKAAKVEDVAAVVGRDGEKNNHHDKKKKMTVMTKSPMSSDDSTNVTPTVSEPKDITYDERLVPNTVSFGDDDGKWENLSIPNVESASTTTPTSFTSTESEFVSSDEKQKGDDNDASSTMSPSNNLSYGHLVSPSASSTVTQASFILPHDDLDEPFGCDNNEDKSDPTLKQVKRNDAYVSKEDLVLLLPSESYEEYESMIQNEREQNHADQPMRKLLIQEELSNLLQRMREMNDTMEDEPELEPEAEEALGIAANRVCYLQKYYDVATCDYVFVPSVAFALMNGSLLDEAAKHYYGKSEEFLVTYAASLGSAVLSLKDHTDLINVGIEKESLSPKWNMAEDLDLADDKSPQEVQPKNQSVSDLFFGVVSPRNLKDGSTPWSNTNNSFDVSFSEPKVGENNKNNLPSTKNKKRMNRKIKLAIGIYIILAVTFSCILLVLKPQFETNHTLDLEEVMTSSRPFELPTDSIPQSPGKTFHIPSTPRTTTQDPFTIGMPTTRTTAETVPADMSTQQQRTPMSSQRTSTRPIVANLLYYH